MFGCVPARRRNGGCRRAAASDWRATRCCCYLNAHTETVDFKLPTCNDDRWTLLFDTAVVETAEKDQEFAAGAVYPLQSRSLALFRIQAKEK